MAAALTGDPNVTLALGNPQHRAALGALKEAVEILLPLFFPIADTQPGQRRDQGEKTLVFGAAAGNVPTENPEIAENQSNQRQQPEYRACGTAHKHGDDQQHAGEKAGGHGKGIRTVSSRKKWLFSSHIRHLPFAS